MLRRFTIIWILLLSALTISCTKSATLDSTSEQATNKIITGVAQLGPIKAAAVIAYKLNVDGTRGDQLATGLTDSLGAFSVELSSSSDPFVLVVSGGSYTEEASGTAVSMADKELISFVDDPKSTQVASVTALTHIAAKRALSLRESGIAIAEAIQAAKAEVETASGIKDIFAAPSNPELSASNDSPEARKYAVFLAGLSEMATAKGINSLEVSNAFANDFTNDGSFDGTDSGASVLLGASGQYLGNDDWSTDLKTAMDTYITSPDNISGFIAGEALVPISAPAVDLPPVSLDPIAPPPSVPMFFALQTQIPLPVGACVPLNLLVLDSNLKIIPLPSAAQLFNFLAFDPYLAKIYLDSSCSTVGTNTIPLISGALSQQLFIRANSSGYLDFHNYQIMFSDSSLMPLMYLGQQPIFADPYAYGSIVPSFFQFMGPPNIATGTCNSFTIQLFNQAMMPAFAYNGGFLTLLNPNPSMYEFFSDPTCTVPTGSLIPLAPNGYLTNIFIKANAPGPIDLMMTQATGFGYSGSMPLMPIGNTMIFAQ